MNINFQSWFSAQWNAPFSQKATEWGTALRVHVYQGKKLSWRRHSAHVDAVSLSRVRNCYNNISSVPAWAFTCITFTHMQRVLNDQRTSITNHLSPQPRRRRSAQLTHSRLPRPSAATALPRTELHQCDDLPADLHAAATQSRTLYQGDHSFSTMIFHDFSMTKKWISMTYRHSKFFRNKQYTIYECYQNKNIFPVAHQSVSK